MTLEHKVKSFLRTVTIATAITIGANYISYYLTENYIKNHEQQNGKDAAAELSARVLQDNDVFEYPISFGKKSAAREYIINYIITNATEEIPKKQEKNTYKGDRHFVVM